MEELGFEKVGKYYHHPDTDFYIDFVSGPPSVGREPIRKIVEIELGLAQYGRFRQPILSRIDSLHSSISRIVKVWSRLYLSPSPMILNLM